MAKILKLGLEVDLDSKGAIKGIRYLDKEIDRVGKTGKRASKGVGQLGKALGTLGLTIGAAGLARGLQDTVKTFATFEQQIANVQNITGMADEEMAKMEAQIRALPPTLGTATELTKGLYQTISSGISDPAEAFKFLQMNAKAAKGNLADLTQTINASSSIMAAFQLETDQASNVLDAMTKTVDLGKLTFSDLANNIGKVSAIAASAGLEFEELFAATAQLTLGGLSVEEAMTGIKAIMTSSLSPTEQQAEAMKRLQVDIGQAALESKGFVKYMEDIAVAVDGNASEMAALFPNVRAIGSALALAREEGAEFGNILEQIGGATGKVESNFANMSEALQGKMDAMNATWEESKLVIGSELAPLVIDFLTSMMENLPPIVAAIGDVIAVLKEYEYAIKIIIPLLATLWAASKIQTYGLAVEGAATAMGGLAIKAKMAAASVSLFAVGIGAIVAAGAAAVYGLHELAKEIDRVADAELRASYSQDAMMAKFAKGRKANKVSVQELANELGVVQKETESLEKSVWKELQARNVSGEATERHRAILRGLSVEIKDAGKSGQDLAKQQAEIAAKMQAANSVIKDLQKGLTDLSKKFKSQLPNAMDKAEQAMRELQEEALLFQQNAETLPEAWRNALQETGELAHHVAEEFETSFSDIEAANDSAVAHLEKNPPGPAIVKDIDKAQVAFSDLLGKGFMGELETFADLWDAVWQDLAKSMTGILGDAIQDAFSEGGGGFGQLFGSGEGSLHEMVSENRMGMGIGGAGMAYQGYQQGDVLTSALGMAMAGAAIGSLEGPVGTAVGAAAGAVLGAAAAFFGGEDDPSTHGNINFGTGTGSIHAWGDQDTSPETRRAWMQDRVEQYNAAVRGMNSVVRAFNDADLFDLIKDPQDWSFDLDMSMNDLATYFGEELLPNMMRRMFRRAINTGLRNLDVDNATLRQLWSELDVMGIEQQMEALADYVTAVVDGARLIEDLDWNAILDESRMGSMAAFASYMDEVFNQISVASAGMENMSLIERAQQAQTIEQLIMQARQREIQMLQQIDAIQKGINESISAQIEGIRIGGMTDAGRESYYTQQIEDIMRRLRQGEAGSPEQVQQMMVDLQRYIGDLSGVLGEDLYTSGMDQVLMGWLEEARGLSNLALDDFRMEIQETNAALLAEMQRIYEGLTTFGDAVTSSLQEPTQIELTGSVDIHVHPSEMFEVWVDNKIMNAVGGGPLN